MPCVVGSGRLLGLGRGTMGGGLPWVVKRRFLEGRGVRILVRCDVGGGGWVTSGLWGLESLGAKILAPNMKGADYAWRRVLFWLAPSACPEFILCLDLYERRGAFSSSE